MWLDASDLEAGNASIDVAGGAGGGGGRAILSTNTVAGQPRVTGNATPPCGVGPEGDNPYIAGGTTQTPDIPGRNSAMRGA